MTEPYSVPVIPGTQPPFVTTSSPPPTLPQPKRRRRWLIPLLAGVAVLLAVGGAAMFYVLRNPEQFRATTEHPLTSAWRACGGAGELSDGDRTLYLDMLGEKDTVGLKPERVSCVLKQLNTPDYVIREMEQTTALAGRQTDHWGSFEASWTYHPDRGLDLVIREK